MAITPAGGISCEIGEIHRKLQNLLYKLNVKFYPAEPEF